MPKRRRPPGHNPSRRRRFTLLAGVRAASSAQNPRPSGPPLRPGPRPRLFRLASPVHQCAPRASRRPRAAARAALPVADCVAFASSPRPPCAVMHGQNSSRRQCSRAVPACTRRTRPPGRVARSWTPAKPRESARALAAIDRAREPGRCRQNRAVDRPRLAQGGISALEACNGVESRPRVPVGPNSTPARRDRALRLPIERRSAAPSGRATLGTAAEFTTGAPPHPTRTPPQPSTGAPSHRRIGRTGRRRRATASQAPRRSPAGPCASIGSARRRPPLRPMYAPHCLGVSERRQSVPALP